MLLEKLTLEEQEFAELFFDSQCLAECLFSNPDNLAFFDEEHFMTIRLGQLPLLSWEYGIFTDIPGLTEKEKFKFRENTGNIYCFAARLWGKTFVGEKIDLLLYLIYCSNEECGFSSFDFKHIQGVLEPLVVVMERHPIIKLFIENIKRNPYYITTRNGVMIESINMNVADGVKAGQGFFQKHLKRLYIEEASRETPTVYENRAESRSEIGCVERILGMTNITRHSPAGKVFDDSDKKGQTLNAPSFINPNYDEIEERKAIKKYNGKQSVSFRVFVEGEIIDDGISALDMNRIRETSYPHKADGSIDEKVTIKNLEVNKESFGRYMSLLIVERPLNIERLVIASDIGGLGGTTEIIVMGEIKSKWRYLYNITIRNLTEHQQYNVFKFLYQKLNPNYVACDSTDAMGRGIIEQLELDKEVDKTRLISVGFNENIEVGVVTDNKGTPIRDNGKLIKKYENTTIWSIQRLCYLLYEGMVFLPLDYKLDEQLSSVVAITRGNEISYQCIARENHLYQAFQVFAIAQFLIEYSGFTKKENLFLSRHDKAGV